MDMGEQSAALAVVDALPNSDSPAHNKSGDLDESETLPFDMLLPSELLALVVSFLDGVSLVRVAQTSRVLGACTNAPSLWEGLLRTELHFCVISYDQHEVRYRAERVPPKQLYVLARSALAANERFYAACKHV